MASSTRTLLPRTLPSAKNASCATAVRPFSSTTRTLAGAEPSSSSRRGGGDAPRRDRDGNGPPTRRGGGGGGGRGMRSGSVASDPRAKLGLLSPVPARTSFSDARLLDANPSRPFDGLQAPLPSSASDAPHASAGGALPIGPGNHVHTSLRYAERGLHFHLDGRARPIGQNGTMYGVRFPSERAERVRAVAQDKGGNVADALRQVQKEEYLARVGGDYSAYLPASASASASTRAGGSEAWKDTVRRALAPQSRSNVTPSVVERFNDRVEAILRGEHFGAVVADGGKTQRKKKKEEVSAPEPTAAAAGPAKGKGGKRK